MPGRAYPMANCGHEGNSAELVKGCLSHDPETAHRNRTEHHFLREEGQRLILSPKSQRVEQRQIMLVRGDGQRCLGPQTLVPNQNFILMYYRLQAGSAARERAGSPAIPSAGGQEVP